MEHNLEDTLALLERTPAVLNALLRDLPEMWTRSNEGEKSWSAYDVVGHLIHCEHTNWMPRARVILESGESQAFPPFRRVGQESDGWTLGERLDAFAQLRAGNLAELRGWQLGDRELALRGGHPALGTVTLAELLATWATHDLTHLHQITRVMAYQYRETVGPFRRFLGVLQCDGHSAPA